jgi:competence protein ComFC
LTDGLSLGELFMTQDILCGFCRKQLIPLRKTIPVLDFEVYAYYEYEAFFEKLIFQFKESKDVTLAPVFLYPYIKHLKKQCEGKTVILVPSSLKKTKQRGFDALQCLYDGLGIELFAPFEKDDVKQSQRGAHMRSRIKNHIRLAHRELIQGKDVILLDDVCTTGYSIKACLDLIKLEVKSVKVVVLAVHSDNLKTRSPI